MDALRKECAVLDSERRSLTRDYRAERDGTVALLMAKQNVDRILGKILEPRKTHEHDAR